MHKRWEHVDSNDVQNLENVVRAERNVTMFKNFTTVREAEAGKQSKKVSGV